ncbi:hypothetical protein AL755_13075 [Arthrobacter sp. ERGS1:01]|uniref:TetR/AcrR family transcriptional regulator n=1 Tax=Arthrobacter sp. ERGS1:01 TaxID=1704044 RepID=UPI0006B4C19E|nr:TetR/AcrR family transcriptional regulator [Arthrobacter sp. ERGS1:01]ALE06179.1 hypothetical protein AL755_13075 [Arthrobacter sp. ERGS1:01]
MDEKTQRSGRDTKAEAQRVALALFSAKGYEATSLREIADHLGISKASLYYHFKSKEDIVTSQMTSRGNEAAELLAWTRTQPASPELLERTVLRWVDGTTIDKLRGIRFINTNPALMRTMKDGPGVGTLRESLSEIAEFLAGDQADPARILLIRMALLSINSAASAAAGTPTSDEDIVEAARSMARALLAELRSLD